MSNTFFVVLPSNVSDRPENRPNHYRVHLPKPVYLQGNYVCALYSIQYPLSWPSTIGTLEPQWLEIKLKEDSAFTEYNSVRIPIPAASLTSVEELLNHLNHSLQYAKGELNINSVGNRRKRHAAGDEDWAPSDDEKALIKENYGSVCFRSRKGGRKIICRRRDRIPTKTTTPGIELTTGHVKRDIVEAFSVTPFQRASPPSKKEFSVVQAATQESAEEQRPESSSPSPPPLDFIFPSVNVTQISDSPPSTVEVKDTENIKEEGSTTEEESKLKSSSPADQDDSMLEEFFSSTIALPSPPAQRLVDSTVNVTQLPQSPSPTKEMVEVEVSRIPVSTATTSTKTSTSTTMMPSTIFVSTPNTPVEMKNIVTVNVNLDGTVSTTKPTVSTSQQKVEEEEEHVETTMGTVNVTVEGGEGAKKRVDEPEKPQPKVTTPKATVVKDGLTDFQRISKMLETIKFEYRSSTDLDSDDDDTDDDEDEQIGSQQSNRFRMLLAHPAISHIEMSEQLAYVLGFPNAKRVLNGEVARYAADLHGGFSSFAVYARGLTEELILGNSLSSLLRIVAVDGNQRQGSFTEKIYDSPMYVKVLPREINEIEIELRTLTGQFVPFQFGNVIVTLVFRKVINL